MKELKTHIKNMYFTENKSKQFPGTILHSPFCSKQGIIFPPKGKKSAKTLIKQVW